MISFHPFYRRQAAFSLIFVSILLTVASLIFVSFLPGQEAGDANQKTINNLQKLERVEEAMRSFMVFNGRRPCPADGQYAVNTANFGKEAATPGTCTGSTPAAPLGLDVGTGYVVGGVIPTRSLGLPDEYQFDEWGRRFTYIVDKRATSNSRCLILEALNGSYVPTGKGGLYIYNTASGGVQIDQTMYAYISHGASGYGAWPAQGSTVANRINSGSTDTDMQTNAGVNSSFTYSTTNFTNVKVKKDRVAPTSGDTGFDDLVWYRPDIKNYCCLGSLCVLPGLARPRSLQQVGLPVELTRAVTPADNPQTPEKIALGQKLFFEGRLSADGTVACATCHDPARAFTDGRPTSVGIHGRTGQRNAPTVLNALYNKAQFWDGRAQTLEEQAALPIVNSVEMGQPSLDAAVTKIARIEEYERAFRTVFGRPVNGPDLLRAIASYERTLVAFDSPFDHFIAGDKNAIDDDARRGWELFNTQARCNKCHALTDKKRDVTKFMDNDFHNIGIGIIRHDVAALAIKAKKLIASGDQAAIDGAAIGTDLSALGRFLITKKGADTAAFKTPNLRNVLVTGPYFHDGSQETLWDVIDHYNKGAGLNNPWLDEDIQPLALTEQDIDDLVAFLASLTSPEYRNLGAQELERQRTLSRTSRPQRDTKRAFGPKPPRPKPPGL